MSPNNRELGLKFTTDSAGLSLARESRLFESAVPDGRGRTLTSAYFETPAYDLRKQRITLRVRRSGRSASVMTLKWPSAVAEDPFGGEEIEVRTSNPQPDITLFDAPLAAKLKQIIEDRPLRTQFETQIKRSVRRLTFGNSQIEAAFDAGVIAAGNRRWPVTEIVLDLKSGEASDLFEFGAQVAECLPARLDVTSQAERAFLLVANESPVSVKAVAQQFPPNATLDDAVHTILTATLGHFVANWAALRAGEDPESVHQARVALRRLRVALTMFKRILPCPEFEAFRVEAKRIASAFGPARECDVLRGLVDAVPLSRFSAPTSFDALLAMIAERRVTAYADVRALVDAPETSVFAMRLQGFLARRGWRNALSAQELAQLTEPANVFAAATLARLHKRARKRGQKLMTLPDAGRHEVRIALKKIRYATEFLGTFFGEASAVRAYVHAVARVQDLLGAHNDAVSAESFLNAAHTTDAKTARAAGIVLGWYARSASVTDAELKKAWKVFRRTNPFEP